MAFFDCAFISIEFDEFVFSIRRIILQLWIIERESPVPIPNVFINVYETSHNRYLMMKMIISVAMTPEESHRDVFRHCVAAIDSIHLIERLVGM